MRIRRLLGRIYLGIKILIDRFIWSPYKSRCKNNIVDIGSPLQLNPDSVDIDNYVRLNPDIKIISAGARVKIKKYSAIGSGCLIVPGSHVPTIGVPQYLSTLHLNDRNEGIIINEDCWIGAECALLCGCELGRGCVVGARSVVTKKIPPYAVVAGIPAKIIATKFSLEEIIEHERILYPIEERLDIKYLNELFETKYKGLKSIGTSELSEVDLNRLNERKRAIGIEIYE